MLGKPTNCSLPEVRNRQERALPGTDIDAIDPGECEAVSWPDDRR